MANKAKIVTVEFTDACFVGRVGYRPGDVAGFTETIADELVNGRKVKEGNREVKQGPWAKVVGKAKTADEVTKARGGNQKAEEKTEEK